MKLSPHEQKILDIVNSHPQILNNAEERTKVAELHNLSEKTLRNRIAELKKRGLISPKGEIKNFTESEVLVLRQCLKKLEANFD